MMFIASDSQIFSLSACELGRNTHCPRLLQMPGLPFTSAVEKDFSNGRNQDSVKGSLIGINSHLVVRFGQHGCALHVIALCM